MKKIFIYILLSFHVFFTGNFGVVLNNYFSIASAASNTWDFSDASDYTLSDDVLSSIQNGQVDLDLQLIQLDAIGNNGVNPLLDGARRLSLSGDYTYVSTYRQDALQVLDHSDPSNITAGVNFVHNTGSLMLDGAIDSAIKGDYLYVAEYIGDSIQIFDISNPAIPVAAGNLPNSTTVRLNGPRGLAVDGDYLYVASFVDDAIQIFDISDPSTLIDVGELDTVNGRLNGARDIIIEGDYAYVSARNGDSIQIIDISDPTNPVFASATSELVHNGTTVFLDSVWGIDKQGDYIYATGYNDDRIQIIDVSDPTLPVAVTNLSTAELPGLNGPRDLVADGDFLFIADYLGDSIMVVDISDPTNPVRESELINSTTTNLNGPIALERDGDLLHIATFPDDDYIILESGYSDTSPSITANTAFNYGTEELTSFTETPGSGNQGNITYQISKNNGTDWYYYNGTAWTLTTGGVSESSSASIINTNISGFNSVGSGNDFLWRAFLTSDGNQRVELNNIEVISAPPPPMLFITKTDNDDDNIVKTDQVVRYTINLSNSGSNATGITITDIIDTDFGSPYNFVYSSCGSPSENFADPTLTFSSIEVLEDSSCTIEYDLQVDSLANDGNTITNSADPSVAAEGGNDPTVASSDPLTVLACGINDVEITFNTDNWGEDTYWSLTPTGNACGVGEIANGGNTTDLTCLSAGSQSANAGNGYPDNTATTEGPYSLSVGTQYDLHVIDDWGDGITATDPDILIQQNGINSDVFAVENTGGIFTFTVQEPIGCSDTISPSVTIKQADSQNDPTLIDSATFKVVFNEVINMATFTSGDISLSGTTGTVTLGPVEVAPNNGTSFEFSVTGMTDGDVVTANILAGVIEDTAGNLNIASTSVDNQITYIGGDTTAPIITSISVASGSLLPGGNHSISIEYSDSDSGINESSNFMQLFKWDGVSSYGPNIFGTDMFLTTLNSTGATYSTNDLDFGKYLYSFEISDNDGNTSTSTGAIFYIDEPEFIISTPEIDMGNLSPISNTFSPTVSITVKTVGAGFNVTMNSDNSIDYNSESINTWDGITGFGYDQDPFSTNIASIGINENIALEGTLINTNGDKNTYTYDIKLGALIDMQQAAGEYLGNIDFNISLTY